MYSAEDISKYGNHNNNYYSSILANDTMNHSYVHKSPKKDKKWSFGNLFRRKKKNDSDSSSEDECLKKKKLNRRSTKANNLTGFDHIIVPPNGYTRNAIFSEPDYKNGHNFIPASEITRPSRKCKREGVKARAEARIRDSSKGEGSSDEDSAFKSDESITSSNRRSRAARTQRYLRRHSKDGELQVAKSDELWKPRATFSGLSTIPPGNRAVTSNKSSSFCDYGNKNKLSELNNHRSVSYDGNIHHTARTPSAESVVIHAQLPLGFAANMYLNHRVRAPPPPPPRDRNRLTNMQNGESRPMSFSFDHKTNSDQLLHRLNQRPARYRSTSEDQLTIPPQELPAVPRPSSTTPKSNDYRYLTDRNPRSRKPICVMQPASFDFWRQQEETTAAKSPVMFTAKTHVTTSIYAQPDNCNLSSSNSSQGVLNVKTTNLNINETNTSEYETSKRPSTPLNIIENEPRKSTNLEEALDELEAIYKSLHLGDEDLLDRAAEREAIVAEQNTKPKIKSEPDPKSDDMAYRKFRKDRHNTVNDLVSPGSYLLTSPVFGSNADEFPKTSNKEPDVTLDDVVYRNVKHTNNTLKVIEPQPPFGIPVGPVLPSANSDYLHAAPHAYQKSKKMPDIVKDDLAYRNLRKDPNKEPALPHTHLSREDYLNNNNYKKKRAVRSLSANIFNLMHMNQKTDALENNQPGQNIDDVADALEMARQILKEKEDKINATRKAFMSDGELKYKKCGSPKMGHRKLQLDEENSWRLGAKPPRSSKASTPVPVDASSEDAELEKALQHSTLEELLTSLARETSEHITNGLSVLDVPHQNAKTRIDEQTTTLQPCPETILIQAEPCIVEPVISAVITPEIMEEEHDYVNLPSDDANEPTTENIDNVLQELTGSGVPKEVIGNEDSDKVGDNQLTFQSWFAKDTKMSETDDNRAERMARYKEERRKQLAAQFGQLGQLQAPTSKRTISKDNSSTSEEPRTTRASRLRAAAIGTQESSSTSSSTKLIEKEKASSSSSIKESSSSKSERDKSSKRKSNLNRALNSEEVPHFDTSKQSDDPLQRRRRRRFFPPEVLQHNHVSSTVSSQPKKTELSVHMENARKGHLVPYSEMGKCTRSTSKRTEIVNANKENNPSSLRRSTNVSKRMDELSALTREALERVETLAKRNSSNIEVSGRSILKKKSIEEAAPVSILKRRISQEESPTPPTQTPPVTFSPSVIDPSTSRKRQGILKKRRSLDEAQVLRHRSCSPSETKSILKNRRSSLEELTLHSILKRKSSHTDDEMSASINSPEPTHGILKRKTGLATVQHVSITTAVILAAAGGAEMILDEPLTKPILKKKSSLPEESTLGDYVTARPILKKKFSIESDDTEDKPKKPILKNSDADCRQSILKTTGSRENSPRPRLSFCTDDETNVVKKSARRSYTICTDTNVRLHEDRDLKKPRPLSVSDIVLNIEKRLSTGAVPKRSGSRHSERYRTQPVTYNELEASLNSVQSTSFQVQQQITTEVSTQNAHSLLDLTTSFNTNNNILNLDNFLSSSLPSSTMDSGGKMSSDSAFQSLGDGLELEQEERVSPVSSEPAKLQMKALAEEAAKNVRLKTGYRGRPVKSTSSRFSTQPITLGEVRQAAACSEGNNDSDNEPEPSRLSISERIKLFNAKPLEEKKPRFTRFQTQPITLEEIESARVPVTDRKSFALDNMVNKEKRGILKSGSGIASRSSVQPPVVDQLKSVLKKKESSAGNLKSILKPESGDFSRDEGISSDETDSDSDVAVVSDSANLEQVGVEKGSGCDTTQTSDGDSSGGREVRSIILGTNKRKTLESYNNEGALLKSKSQGLVRDEEEKQTSPTVRRSLTQTAMPKMIAELQAKLQKSGDKEWRKRIPRLNTANEELGLLNVKNIYNEELSEKTSILAVRKDELDAASKQWKNRVEQSDAVNFSVVGRMQQSCNKVDEISINIPAPAPDKSKRTPKAKAFRSKEGGDSSTATSTSTPSSPEKDNSNNVRRSISLPGAGDEETSKVSDVGLKVSTRKVQVERPDNITFRSFFTSTSSKDVEHDSEISVDDFDSISRENLLVQKRTVKFQRRREASKNPVKALAAREDIKDEYTEIITGIAEREKLRLNVEKLSKTSNFAIEALAGLASKEDFSSVALKRSSSMNTTYPPFSDLMLLQIKGRRYVQTRLVEPIASSINDGDCFILVTPDTIYNYIGTYANIIEQSRASDIVTSIQQTSDLGCKCDKVVVINAKKLSSCSSADIAKFWSLLGATKDFTACGAGHPDEDEIYELSIFSTNMIYEYKNEMLVPFELYWGTMPKIQMLSPLKIFVFDYGSEMYFWSGKNALLDDKKKALKLARELWNEGFNYTECNINPLDVSTKLGARSTSSTLVLKGTERPKWTLFGKITQHRETVLFKEKFLDWPDYSRVIRVKKDATDKNWDKSKYDFKPCDVDKMLKANTKNEPDLEIDGIHLGRGISYFSEETNRLFSFTTRSITCWVILEFSQEKLEEGSAGQFHNAHSYIVRWEYCAHITGRELSGKPSKHVQAGRDNCVYFCWQGNDATINEKGAAALITVQLDSENARQIRVLQGYEPPVFLNLFNGAMVVHCGKRDTQCDPYRLYICRGEIETESCLTEVPCSMRSLRSRASFLLVSNKSIVVWNGFKTTPVARKVAKRIANIIAEKAPLEFDFSAHSKVSVTFVEEGSEPENFLNVFGGDKRQLYRSLIKHKENFDYTPRLYHLSSISGTFDAVEVHCSYRSEHVTAYPFLQSDLYMANQPALFMLDNQYEVWLWQGWWPDREDDDVLSDQTGSGAIRWQEERKAAMQTVVNYRKRLSPEKHVPAYLVWAGLEPLAFTNLFPYWRDHDDVAELNIQDGRKAGDALVLEKELDLLTRSTYPLDQLLQRPLPDGVDPTQLENYLSTEDFAELMSMTLEEFQKLPTWKQTAVKKEKGLF